ncbi:hypothetical protein [Bacillus gaemokensis]|uniref:Uncharacterized protein n=1 Tax=Bacillus gaemokensis TaxID=574375 RepID=A0A073KBD9_9BACI|nr:hypothetical protein [Bacillus gaemokensis]KEK23875.1 hypothetical protein BAGA_05385 [Bacillus gaemokensis]KYG38117.1 hypothetical protein AZF08_20420 [Bacillus gaemokensis]
MSQKITNHEDMQSLEKIEEVIISLELSTQKSLSLIALSVDRKEAFAESFNLIDETEQILSGIKDSLIRTIAKEKILDATESFQSKMHQV